MFALDEFRAGATIGILIFGILLFWSEVGAPWVGKTMGKGGGQ